MNTQILPYKYTERHIGDCVVAVIWDQNESIILVDHPDRGFWFPFKNKSKDESTLDVAKKITQVLASFITFPFIF